jgi:predicted small integral membrane protein
MTEYDKDRAIGDARFITLWTVLIMLGLAAEFIGRFFGYEDNPLAIYHPIISALGGIVAAFIILAGVMTLMGKNAQQQTMSRRRSVLLITLGGAMLIGFFIFKQAIPLIFG